MTIRSIPNVEVRAENLRNTLIGNGLAIQHRDKFAALVAGAARTE
jgi:hypothetical protein